MLSLTADFFTRRRAHTAARPVPSYLITNETMLPALEGLRGWAAVMVFFSHFPTLFFGEHQYCRFGYLCVDLFFIISGFIIARRYEEEVASGKISFRQFAIVRIARLYPMYLVGLCMLLYEQGGMANPHNTEPFSWQLLTQLLMLENLLSRSLPFLSVEWSTSVEWIINVVFFYSLWRWRRIPTLWLVLVLLANLAFMLHYAPALDLYLPEQYFFNTTIARGLAGFCLGWLIFRFHTYAPKLTRLELHALEILLIELLLCAIIKHDEYFWNGIGYVFVLGLFPVMLLLCLYRGGWLNRIFSSLVMVWIGHISYSVYILHRNLGYFYSKLLWCFHFVPEYPFWGIGYFCFVMGISTFTYATVEKPFRKWGKELAYGKRGQKPAHFRKTR